MSYKIGDTVNWNDEECTIVDWDEINEVHIVEDSSGERVGVDAEQLNERGIGDYATIRSTEDPKGLSRVAKKAKWTGSGLEIGAEKPGNTLSKDERRALKNSVKRADASKLSAAITGKGSGNKPTSQSDIDASIARSQEEKSKRSLMRAKEKLSGLLQTTKPKSNEVSVPEKTPDWAKLSRPKRWTLKKESHEPENEENTIMDQLEVGDIVVYEDAECLVVECNDETVILEDDKGEKVEVSLDEIVAEEEQLDELTKAGETIKGKASYNTSGMTASMIKTFAGMSSSDQVDFFNKMMSQYGPSKDWGTGDKSGKNKSSIAMKGSSASSETVSDLGKFQQQMTKEDLDQIMAGEDLSEEFKSNASTLFEAAINLRVATIKEELEAEYESALEESMAELTEELESNIDSYLSYVAEEWVAENEVAIESNLKNELSESFIQGLHELFAEHYIDVPESKIDVVEEMATRVTELEEQLNESLNDNIELCEAIQEFSAEEIFNEMCDGLAMTQQEKFRTLTEGVEFDGDEDEYRSKLGVIREKYFQVAAPASTLNEEIELVESLDDEKLASDIDPAIAQYVGAISRTIKR